MTRKFTASPETKGVIVAVFINHPVSVAPTVMIFVPVVPFFMLMIVDVEVRLFATMRNATLLIVAVVGTRNVVEPIVERFTTVPMIDVTLVLVRATEPAFVMYMMCGIVSVLALVKLTLFPAIEKLPDCVPVVQA